MEEGNKCDDVNLNSSDRQEENSTKLKDTPVIGILTNPKWFEDCTTFIMRAYVKYFEQWGLKVVAIKNKDSDEEILALLEKLNGVVISGGSSAIFKDGVLSPFANKIKLILNKTKEMNDKGIHFPFFGIWLGFQAIPGIETNCTETVAIDQFDSLDTSDPVKLTIDPSISRLHKNMPAHLLEALQTEPITYNSHHDGVYPSVFTDYEVMKENYHMIGTSTDRKGVEYVATFEHKTYPIYCHQYHPEKIEFVFREGVTIPRTENAVGLSRYYAEFFANDCRMNANHFDTPEEEEASYINHARVLYTTGVSQDVYAFVE